MVLILVKPIDTLLQLKIMIVLLRSDRIIQNMYLMMLSMKLDTYCYARIV